MSLANFASRTDRLEPRTTSLEFLGEAVHLTCRFPQPERGISKLILDRLATGAIKLTDLTVNYQNVAAHLTVVNKLVVE